MDRRSKLNTRKLPPIAPPVSLPRQKVNPRPFHRSRLFWLGLPGFIFLLWLWLGTRDTQSVFQWRLGHKHAIAVGTSAGTSDFGWATVADPNTISFDGPQGWEITKATPGPLFPSALTGMNREIFTGFHRRNLVFAHWFLLLVYLALWLTACAIWQYRKHRITAPNLSTSGSQSSTLD